MRERNPRANTWQSGDHWSHELVVCSHFLDFAVEILIILIIGKKGKIQPSSNEQILRAPGSLCIIC